MCYIQRFFLSLSCLLLRFHGEAHMLFPADTLQPAASFRFNGNTSDEAGRITGRAPGIPAYTKGLSGQALRLGPGTSSVTLEGETLVFDTRKDLSLAFWVRTNTPSNQIIPLLSQKPMSNAGVPAQKTEGWMFYCSGGTWAWNTGTGKRRLTYERENGQHMPLNDGKWHQLAMTYNSARSEIRLYYDGNARALYNIGDSVGFSLRTGSRLVIGANGVNEADTEIMDAIQAGATELQQLADAFERLGVGAVKKEDFLLFLSDPRKIFRQYVRDRAPNGDTTNSAALLRNADFSEINKIRSALLRNPYTVHQVIDFVEVAPVSRFYTIGNGKIQVKQEEALAFAESRKIHAPSFDMDELQVWNRTVTPSEIRGLYKKFFPSRIATPTTRVASLVAADWNIWHGGKHFTKKQHGFDSRIRIAEMLKENGADVIMMQESYSSGEFIAAELGFYYASTADWDYLNQGSNISVMSRYPIKELHVPAGAPFMNVAVKVELSRTQDIYVMSNWYGMQKFDVVYDFHKERFAGSDSIPVLFAGDFNAVPYMDGGKENPASVVLTGAGFTDAFRKHYPDVKAFPGHSHIINERIDQFYYKGRGLKSTSFKQVFSRPDGYPSDHSLLIATFGLDYSTRE